MKKFENPSVSIEKLEIADVITTSTCTTFTCNNDAGDF